MYWVATQHTDLSRLQYPRMKVLFGGAVLLKILPNLSENFRTFVKLVSAVSLFEGTAKVTGASFDKLQSII